MVSTLRFFCCSIQKSEPWFGGQLCKDWTMKSWCFRCIHGLIFCHRCLTCLCVLPLCSLRTVWQISFWFVRWGFLSEIKFKVQICDLQELIIFAGRLGWLKLLDSSWCTNQPDCGGLKTKEIGSFRCSCGQFPLYWSSYSSFQFWNLINLSHLHFLIISIWPTFYIIHYCYQIKYQWHGYFFISTAIQR